MPVLPRSHPLHRTRVALAAAAAAVCSVWPTAGQAVVIVAGSGFTQPGTVPGHDLLWVGNGTGTTGSIDVNGGSAAVYGGLFLGWNQADATGLITGAGSTLTLDTVGTRLSVGHWGTAELAVLAGAKILADSSAGCSGNCNATLGAFAGTSSSLLVQGAGSEVRIRDNLNLATGGVDTVNGFGTVGGHTVSTLSVLDGGLLATAGGTSGAFNNNRPGETSTARITVSGAGSLWTLSPGTQSTAGARGPTFTLSSSSSNQSFLDIVNGGEMRINSASVAFAGLTIGNNGGTGRLTIAGTGSRLQYTGESTTLVVANSNGASGTVTVNSGGAVQGLFYLGVGRNGGTGSVVVDGAGSVVSLTGMATAAANTSSALAAMEIGRNGGSGVVTVSNGGRIELLGQEQRTNRLSIGMGRDSTSNGVLNIRGTGSEVLLQVASAVSGGGAAESFNPLVNVGREGNGVLDISAGGALRLVGNAVSTVGAARDTTLNIGGLGDTATSGRGFATVSGAGSLLSVTGGDASIRVGRGPGGVGELTISNQGTVETTVLSIGRAGQGTLLADNANINIGGRFGSNSQVTANLGIGNLGGTGIATLRNQTNLTLSTPQGVGVYLGGTGLSLQGTGILNVSGGSSITINADPGNARFVVGYDGTGIASFDSSTLTMAGGRLTVASQASSSGTLRLNNGSVVTTGWAGVGADRLADGTVVDGGAGQLIINNSTLNTTTLEIGSKGYLGGNGTVVGSIVNRGVVNPGNSPGTLVIDGSFINAAGGRIVLEVESDGAGGFVTDHLVFAPGSTVNLAGTTVTFSFLGSTDPVAFKASGGFQIDTFMVQRTAQGDVGLDDASFAGVQFGAEATGYTISNFSFDAATGAGNFTAAPVPEPGTTVLLLAGLVSLGWLVRRRRG